MYDQHRLKDDWDNFCDELKHAGDLILRAEVPPSARTHVEGIRYLTRLLRAGLERSIEYCDPSWPEFYALSHETVKIGSDNPDNVYRNALIDPSLSYRISGKVGNASLLSFASKSDSYSTTGKMIPTGEIFLEDISLGPDGAFEIVASIDKKEGNWLPLTRESSMIIIRETHSRRENRINAEVAIETISTVPPPTAQKVEEIVDALHQAVMFVSNTSTVFADWMKLFKQTPNDWAIVDQANWQAIGGDSNIFYLWGYWELATDEALVIEVTPPGCDYWNFQVNNYWDESLDYRYFQIHHNNKTVTYNDDGSVTIVLSHQTGVHPNFTVTTGLDSGAMMWRWVSATDHPIPKCTKIKLTQLADFCS